MAEKINIILWGIFIFLTIFLIGVSFNLLVVILNGGKMPVYYPEYFNTKNHFSYIYSSRIKLAGLTDIIPIFGNIISLGDVLIFSGVFGYFIFFILLIIKKLK